MNTLSKEITLGRFFQEDPENYVKLRKQWSKMVNSKAKDTLTLADHIIYLILIGKNWQKAICLPTNKNKLENHYQPKIEWLANTIGGTWSGARIKKGVLEHFEGVVTEEAYDNAIKLTDLSMSKEPYRDE